MDLNDEAYEELIEDIRGTCEEYEDELAMWRIEDALTTIRKEYQ